MTEPDKQPRPFDAVLGGNSPPKKAAQKSTPKVSKPSQTNQVEAKAANTDLDTSADGCGVTAKWVIWLGLVLALSLETGIVESLADASVWAMIVGLINPGWVIRFGLPKSRQVIFLIYFVIVMLSLAVSPIY